MAPNSDSQHYPLQQGLRLFAIELAVCLGVHSQHYPLQQGLRLEIAAILGVPAYSQHYPLQQGLRQEFILTHCDGA